MRPRTMPPSSKEGGLLVIQDERGQALVELLLVVLITLMMGVAIYEAGALMHNLSVLDEAAHTAVVYASHGADYNTLRRAVSKEAVNLMAGGFLEQTIQEGGLIVEVWNPNYDRGLGAYEGGGRAPRSQCQETFAPERSNVAPYLFWARGYEVRVGLIYRVGFSIPFLAPVVTETVISESAIIQTSNDLDRDGMNDHKETAYVQWAMDDDGSTQWVHPQHRDGSDSYDTERGVDIDGDGDDIRDDAQPYDFDNDNNEDKYEKDDTNESENRMRFSPLVGSEGWIVTGCS